MLTIHSGEPGMNPQVHIHIWKIVVHSLKILEPYHPLRGSFGRITGASLGKSVKGKASPGHLITAGFPVGQPKVVEK
jgi:hypothetical protein